MYKNKVIQNFSLAYKPLLIYIIILTQGIFFLKFLAFPLFFIGIGKQFLKKINITNQVIFYTFIITYSIFFVLLSSIFDFSIKYIIAALLGIVIWFLCLVNNVITTTIISNIDLKKVKATIDVIFVINAFVSFLQLVILMIEYKAINPFTSEIGMSAGDAIMGIFANSSVNMVIISLYFCFYFFKKEYFNTIIAIIIILLTTYMSGILIFTTIFTLYFLFIAKYSIIKKIILLFSIIALSSIFYSISKDNVDYVVQVSSTVVEDMPPRKLTSLEQTFAFATSSISHFLFGNGIGNFSSRLAFIAGGEYVSWYPSFLVRQSDYFNKNHFQLWNKEILSIPFFDGTANQPFSLYSQLIGEYGFIGLVFFAIFYIKLFYKKLPSKSYARLMLFLGLGFMFLDYWFEYFSVMIFLELFFNFKIIEREKTENALIIH